MIKSIKTLFVVQLIVIFFPITAISGNGDTLTVQTFTFGSPLEKKFWFPDASYRWEKILMYYTLKCNPKQSPACGEWDYLTYTYLYRHTGVFDSIQYSHPNFTWNGNTPDTLNYMNSPSFTYEPWFELFNQTLPVDTAKIGMGTNFNSTVFSGPAKDSRSQALWKKTELTSAGLQAGQITGIRFNFKTVGTGLNRLTIRVKNYTTDSLPSDRFVEGGFTEVYNRDHLFTGIGWQVLPFTFPFMWDGSSNLLVDISYQDQMNPAQNSVFTDDPGFGSMLISNDPDYSLNFRDNDFIKLPGNTFQSVDSAVTIAFWIFGNPLLQPQNNTVFEGTDSLGVRVINLHLPWSDSKVYWDAGKDSNGYDRLPHPITDPSMYRGKWNHWAFVKDVKTARMKIYANGQLLRVGTGKHKRMNGISQFRIGSNAQGSDYFYDGMIDDFTIWNKELSDTVINNYMYRDIDSLHPDYSHLVAWYKFNEGAGFQSVDAASGHHSAILRGYPDWQSYNGKDRFRNAHRTHQRPMVVFEQGNYDPAALDSVLKVDTLTQSPMMVILYNDTVHPYIPTDTITKWPSYYNNYVFNTLGQAIDSTLVPVDGVLYRKDQAYFGKPYELLERFELARYITPYGNNLSLGDGFTWVYDLTDYAPLLHDSVHFSAGNWQELLDMKFKMIEGIPPRDPLAVTNVYTGTHGYANASQHNLPPVKVKIGNNVRNARLKMRITGHGFGGTDNCSEFCPRTNTLKINGTQAYTHDVWRKCGINPLYPQGGTWLYDRAAWCPGAEVSTKDFELSSYVVPGDSMTIDYDLQPGYTWDGQGSWPYYAIESQLITYSQPNFMLDAAMEEIIAPNSEKLYIRFNPICGSPVIAIKNNGTSTLTSVDVKYGPVGGNLKTVHWTGSLAFADTTQIVLPPVDWTGWTAGDNRFVFTLENPNGATDQNLNNNSMTSGFSIPPTYENLLQFKFKTNHEATSESWTLEDENGNVIYQNGVLEQNTLYVDTFRLAKGCYRLVIQNLEGEGLQYWANMPPYGNGTAGYAWISYMDGQTIKAFQPDFGSITGQSFTVGMTINIPELNSQGFIKVIPNPNNGRFTVSLILERPQDIRLIFTDFLGHEIFNRAENVTAISDIPVNISGISSGVYFLTIISGQGTVIKKVLIN